MRCVAFCAADSYRLSPLQSYFKNKGYVVKQYRKVLHVSFPFQLGDAFVFSYGCIVIWGLKHKDCTEFIEQLTQFAINPLTQIESDHFIYKKSDHTEITTHERFNVDLIYLESDSVQLKLAISYGLAQSIQLESYEAAVQKSIDANATFPQQLAKKGSIFLSQKNISKRMGEIFLARSSINLNSEYLEDPEYFWEHPSVEIYYSMTKKFLDIPRRVATLNQKLSVLHDMFEMLTGLLQHKHANILEIIIIVLILIEVFISLITLHF